MIVTSAYVRRKERSQVGNLTFHLKEKNHLSPKLAEERKEQRPEQKEMKLRLR